MEVSLQYHFLRMLSRCRHLSFPAPQSADLKFHTLASPVGFLMNKIHLQTRPVAIKYLRSELFRVESHP